MQSYTYMSGEAIDATFQAQRNSGDSHYEIRFNLTDFGNLLRVLTFAHHQTRQIPTIDGEQDIGDWAGDFASSIATTLGVEMV